MGVYINTVYLPVEGNVVYRIKETERSNTVRESERDMKIWSNLKYHIYEEILRMAIIICMTQPLYIFVRIHMSGPMKHKQKNCNHT